MSRPTWTERLDRGLDPMWDFLRFHPEKPTVHDIEVLENYLDDLRTLMVQKSAGQSGREAKTAGSCTTGAKRTAGNAHGGFGR